MGYFEIGRFKRTQSYSLTYPTETASHPCRPSALSSFRLVGSYWWKDAVLYSHFIMLPVFPPSVARRLPKGLPNPLRSTADPRRQRPSPGTREVYDEF